MHALLIEIQPHGSHPCYAALLSLASHLYPGPRNLEMGRIGPLLARASEPLSQNFSKSCIGYLETTLRALIAWAMLCFRSRGNRLARSADQVSLFR